MIYLSYFSFDTYAGRYSKTKFYGICCGNNLTRLSSAQATMGLFVPLIWRETATNMTRLEAGFIMPDMEFSEALKTIHYRARHDKDSASKR
jgi:hypothetical protein